MTIGLRKIGNSIDPLATTRSQMVPA